MASVCEMGGRGPKPYFHRTMRPLPKANRTGGGHGAAFPSLDPNPSLRAGPSETTESPDQNPNGEIGLT